FNKSPDRFSISSKRAIDPAATHPQSALWQLGSSVMDFLCATSPNGTWVMTGKQLHISVLGNLAVQCDRTRIELPRSKKTRALLAYLAVTARPHRRERLCAMFWSVPDDPRAALRWSLSRLRPLVDQPDRRRIVADREEVGMDLSHVRVDLLSLRSAFRR